MIIINRRAHTRPLQQMAIKNIYVISPNVLCIYKQDEETFLRLESLQTATGSKNGGKILHLLQNNRAPTAKQRERTRIPPFFTGNNTYLPVISFFNVQLSCLLTCLPSPGKAIFRPPFFALFLPSSFLSFSYFFPPLVQNGVSRFLFLAFFMIFWFSLFLSL